MAQWNVMGLLRNFRLKECSGTSSAGYCSFYSHSINETTFAFSQALYSELFINIQSLDGKVA